MKITGFPHYIFWSYKKDADLDSQIITRQVFQYGDISDMRHVLRTVPEVEIRKTIQSLKNNCPHLKKRIRFIEQIILK